MKEQAEGSRAMTIYIVICFVLAAGALLAFKVTNDKRIELSDGYEAAYQRVFDIQAGLAPNIQDYYRRVKRNEIRPVDKSVKDTTGTALAAAAERLGIKAGVGDQDKLDVDTDTRGVVKYKQYREYSSTVTLKNVTQSEWGSFLRAVLDPFDPNNLLDEYVSVASIEAARVEGVYRKMVPSEELPGGAYADRSAWKVTIKFIWFAPLEQGEST